MLNRNLGLLHRAGLRKASRLAFKKKNEGEGIKKQLFVKIYVLEERATLLRDWGWGSNVCDGADCPISAHGKLLPFEICRVEPLADSEQS